MKSIHDVQTSYRRNPDATREEMEDSKKALAELEQQFLSNDSCDVSFIESNEESTGNAPAAGSDAGTGNGSYLRGGSWVEEEEKYAARIVQDFQDGMLKSVPEGTSLQLLLSEYLCCKVGRIYRKYRGANSLGLVRTFAYRINKSFEVSFISNVIWTDSTNLFLPCAVCVVWIVCNCSIIRPHIIETGQLLRKRGRRVRMI